MAILALYDILGIQKYVYSSSRLKDNIGAAIIVDKCLGEYMEDAIKALDVKYDVSKSENEFKALKDDSIEVEIVYSGGGNSLIYFKDKSYYKKLNLELSKIFIEKAPGIKFEVEYIDVDFGGNFGEDVDLLFKKLQIKKGSRRDVNLAKGISITRECMLTSQPATHLLKGEYICDELFRKRQQVSDIKDSGNKYKLINDLAGAEGEKFIAVVHIDGNNMGKQLNSFVKNSNSYEEGIVKIRNFSSCINEIYEGAYENMISEISTLIDNSTEEKLKMYSKNVPFRKIYIKGDDVTFICYAPLALEAVRIFLEYINKKDEEINDIDLSACCGIAYVKPAYPFDVAYSIAEQCCAYAKSVAKETANEKNTKVGSYVDFHISHSNMLTELSKQRDIKYNMEFLEILKEKKLGRKYNLILRPYEVYEKEYKDTNSITSLETLFLILRWIKNSGVSRSKIKNIRNAYITNLYKLEQAFMDLEGQSKDKKLLEELKKDLGFELNEMFISRELGVSVLYDALELMDLYIEM